MPEAQVGIICGSESDLPKMQEAARVLESFGVGYELVVASAHRAPDLVHQWAAGAEARGLKVIIAGAGMAAALPGVVAALTPLPVIGVPLRAGALDGVDALYSIVQMPTGVPVATVAIDGAKNAGYLAVQILAVADPELRERFRAHKRALAEAARAAYERSQAAGRQGV
ncbi:MAG: 5-(carboxyamino)imidazole ribonucleotide mutase [Firmicutes bacterium]|nr:5-(carboxyamino)imidazole ribonucleotide mutase [Bacillota bacterium]